MKKFSQKKSVKCYFKTTPILKWATIIFVLFILTACRNRTDKTMVNEKSKSVYFDSRVVNGGGGQHYKEFHNCNFDNFIADKTIPKLAMNIYLDNDWNLSNDNEALALLDSLTAKNENSRPFYFKVVTKTYNKSDGYFSEELALAGKEYIENNTKEFISYFDNKSCFTDNDLITWAKIVILEFSISGEGEYDKPIIDDYIKILESNCRDCTVTQKENIDKFGLNLKKEWKEVLKNLD